MAATTDFELTVSPGAGNQGVGPSLIDTLHQNHTFAIILLAAGLIVLAIAIATIIKRRRRINFTGFAKSGHRNIHFLILALLLSFGGLADLAYLHNADAAEGTLPITTSGKLKAEVKSKDEESTLYCGTDNLTINQSYEDGYTIFMKVGNRGKLQAKTEGKSDIESTDDWSKLPKNTWGFIIGPNGTKDSDYNPILLGEASILVTKNNAATAGDKVQVTFCVNLTKKDEETGNKYGAQIEYNIKSNYDLADFANKAMDYLSNLDFDGDNLANRIENRFGTRMDKKDSDDDGLDDKEEIVDHGSDPLNEDTDGDEMLDYSEVKAGTNLFGDYTTPGVKDIDQEYEIEVDPYDGEADKSLPTKIKGAGNFANAVLSSIVNATAEINEETTERIGDNFSIAIDNTVKITNILIDYTSSALAQNTNTADLAYALQVLKVDQESESYQNATETIREGTKVFLNAAIETTRNIAQICIKAINLFRH